MRIALVCVALACFALGGCGILDTAFGVSEGPDGTFRKDGTSPVDAVGDVAGTFFPWAAGAASVLGNVYLALRNRRWFAVAGSMARGVNRVRALPDEQITAAKVVEIMAAEQDAAHVREDAKKVIHAVEAKT